MKARPTLVWNKKVPNTEMEKFRRLMEAKYNRRFGSYWELHKWSVENYMDFWEEVWNYFGVIASKPYDEVLVKTGPGFLDNDWFSGALFNFAENILRIRDNRVALIWADELGNEETVTFAEMFEEVKLYAAAFKKHGLRKGDRVACYMSNIKEAVFGLLAATSIGAIWGGPLPFYGARAASNIIKMMDAKFLLAVDHHQDYGQQFNTFENLQDIAENCPSLEKIIIVALKPETLSKDISHIPNSCFLHEFLEDGRTPDGTVPDIVFEQLPFSHPICINFTSGTTGLPKGPVHSAGSFIAELRDFAFHLNLKSGDVVLTCYPVGWSLWDYFIRALALGVKIFLYSGSPYFERKGANFWDIVAEYKVTLAFLVTSMVDKMEKQQMA
ncbi:Acetoacetyl-CoA synthetase, partial [Stegodyphus mimosarum]